MKKINKKGFTLIELLAVIIILGILMIIAIPSVTTYIQNSRKSAYVDTASAYIDAVRTKVNEASDLKLFSTETLYMIPVGNKASESCVSVESGGKSPFSDEWSYAYVGVTYSGSGYNYFFISEDANGQGLPLVSQDTLSKEGNDYIYSSYANSLGSGKNSMTEGFSGSLKTQYPTAKASAGLNNDEKKAFEVALEKNGSTYGKSKIVYVAGGTNCKFVDQQ